MIVGIVGGDANNNKHLQLIDKELESLIEESGCYLFTMFNAETEGNVYTQAPLPHQYATLRGLPCINKQYKTFDQLMKGLCKEVDYLIILNDKSQQIKRILMAFKQTYKHGSVINI